MSGGKPLPAPRYDHLLSLIDDTGVFEHARHGVPRREYGYTTDDAARALIVLARAPRSPDIDRAISTLLAFLLAAVKGGLVCNRLGFDRRWRDEPGFGDHHGRAVWALAVMAARGTRPEWRDAAKDVLATLAPPEGPHLRPYALAALGATEVWKETPREEWASRVIDRAGEALIHLGLPWPEPRLTYCNARIPDACIRLGEATGQVGLIDLGMELLDWLHRVETRDGHYSFTPVGGWSPGEPRPGFDQQPVEAAAMAEASLTAWRTGGDERWAEATLAAAGWLLGENDVGATIYQASTGACHDGLTSRGVNRNKGAESTVSALAVLQACAALTEERGSRGLRRSTFWRRRQALAR